MSIIVDLSIKSLGIEATIKLDTYEAPLGRYKLSRPAS